MGTGHEAVSTPASKCADGETEAQRRGTSLIASVDLYNPDMNPDLLITLRLGKSVDGATGLHPSFPSMLSYGLTQSGVFSSGVHGLTSGGAGCVCGRCLYEATLLHVDDVCAWGPGDSDPAFPGHGALCLPRLRLS